MRPKFHPVRDFHDLPDEAVIPSWATAALTGLSQKTVRRTFRRIYVSADRYGQAAGEVRARQAHGVPEAERRVRVGPAAMRLVAEVYAAPSRADAEKIIEQFADGKMSADERERLHTLLQDALAELPES